MKLQLRGGASASTRTSRTAGVVELVIILPGLAAGGTERVVNFLSNRWAERGWQVTVLTLDSAASVSFYPYDPRVVIERIALPSTRQAAPRAAWATLRRIGAFRRALKRIQPDLIISFLSRTNVVALLATRGLGMPVVVSERNNPAMQPIGALWGAMRRLLYPRAFGLVTMTRGALDYFPEAMRRRGWIIPNFADPAPVRPDIKAGEGRVLAAVGRLVPQKGFDLLLDAFARVAGDHPDWQLRIWGEGPDRAALEGRRDRLGLAARVELPGVSARHASWVETADAFVLSSRFEGWGIVLLEAMAAGLPVVSFDCRWGPREMIRDGIDGLIVPRENVAELARALALVMDSAALRDRLGKAAAASAERFTPDRVGAAWDAVVDAALVAPVPSGRD